MKNLFLCCIPLILSPFFLTAQGAGRGALSGVVTDTSGAVVPGASVQLTDTATGVAQLTQSSGAGLYSFVSLIPGTYSLQVSKTGFKTSVQQNILISVDVTASVNMALSLGAVTQTVTVSEAPAILEVSPNATTGQLISEEQIDTVPLVTRDVYELAQLAPGINATNGNVDALDLGQGGERNQTGEYVINGAPQGSLYYVLDGSAITISGGDMAGDIPAFESPLDNIQEFRMETNYVPASIQSGAAGVISIVSKSGTNAFHGDGFAYIRPNALDANNYFTKAAQLKANEPNLPPVYDRYQWGGAFGGPIKKDKMFFFGDYEGTSLNSLATLTGTVPTTAETTGDFSADSFTIYDPNPSTWASGPTPCVAPATTCPQPFPGNKITSIDPVAANYVKYWPASNAGGGINEYHLDNYFASGSEPENEWKIDVRIDDALTASQHLFGRVSYSYINEALGVDWFNNLFDSASTDVYHDGNVLLGYDKTLGASSVLQVRASATRHHENQGPLPEEGYNMTTLGFPSALYSESVFHDVPTIKFSSGTSGAVTGFSASFFPEAMTNYEFNISMNTTRGRHELSVGWDYQKFFYNGGQTLAPSGSYSFDSGPVSSTETANNGDAFASFLLGVGSITQSSNFSTDVFGAEGSPYNALFIQDNFQATRNFTITAGLRWEIYSGATERHNRLEYFDPTAQDTVNGVALTGGEVFAKNGARSPYLEDLHDFGPRVGFSYHPLKNLIFRGAYGIFYGPSARTAQDTLYNDDSFQAVTTWAASALDSTGHYVVPENPLSNPFPSGILKPTAGSLGLATNLGNGVNTMLHSQPDLTAYNYNFGIEYELPAQASLSLAWVASRGLHLPFARYGVGANADLDILPLSTIEQYQGTLLNQVPYPYEAAITNASAPWYGHSTVPQWVNLTEYPQFSNGTAPNSGGVAIWGDSLGFSNYNSLQVTLNKRMSHHLSSLAAFTWSKLLTNNNSPALGFTGNNTAPPQDWWDLKEEYSLSTQDMPFIFSWQLNYELPVGSGRLLNLRGWGDEAFGGWSVGSILSLSSGQPIATPKGTSALFFNQRPDIVGNCGAGAPHTAAEWFNYTCMAQPASPYYPGTAPPVLPGVRTDPTHNVDVALSKRFNIGKSGERNLNIRASAYNLTNSVQLGYPDVFWKPPASGTEPTATQMAGFGSITAENTNPRQLSFEGRFTF